MSEFSKDEAAVVAVIEPYIEGNINADVAALQMTQLAHFSNGFDYSSVAATAKHI